MPDPVKKRAYRSDRRRAGAAQTRAAILAAAGALFSTKGYVATTMPEIAADAGVAVDTVYASVGTKPTIFRELIEAAISGTGAAVPAIQRDYVRAIEAEPTAGGKLALYAAAMRRIQPRLAPLVAVLQEAAGSEPELRRLWVGISDRRATNMRQLAASLRGTGELRRGLRIDQIADTLWITNAPETYLLLTRQRGWSDQRYERWLADTWRQVLLARG